MNSIGGSQDDNDTGAPLPDFSNASRISLNTISPGLGIYNAKNSSYNQPDYLEYDIKGRGIMVTMFANAGMSYLLGITGGSIYGIYYTMTSSPSTRFRVQLNSLLNNCGRYGSKLGNTAGIFAIFYSFYENIADNYEFDNKLGFQYTNYPVVSSLITPGFSATATCMTYFAPNGIRVAGLAGTLGLGAVATTYGIYTMLGIPYGYRGYLFF